MKNIVILYSETLNENQVNTGMPFYLPYELQSVAANKIGALKCVENDTVLLNLPKGNFVLQLCLAICLTMFMV
ncbi:hypothetical protein [Clostridium sp.]|uniref:hypothetical protein n=1 Tax=Clostridium sp. TaxID=1506 RepID=UPI000ED0384E|nr:hypothetical protein [Clostridium sp.]HCQ91157.1 hypothetical protein [Clostridium sp.]